MKQRWIQCTQYSGKIMQLNLSTLIAIVENLDQSYTFFYNDGTELYYRGNEYPRIQKAWAKEWEKQRQCEKQRHRQEKQCA